MKPSILYISYDGMLEPLGQSQVIAYLERLAKGYEFHLVSFEKVADWHDVAARKVVAARLKAADIRWHPRRYHKRPTALATAFDIAMGTLTGLWLAWRHGVRVVHARSYVAATMALFIQRFSYARFLFDMRGFWADERADSGAWPRASRLYRFAKRMERSFLLHADHVVSLTHAAVHAMEQFDCLQGKMPPVTVIPTCADLARFRPESEGRRQPLTVGYVGTVGTWYRFDATVACWRELLVMRPDTRFVIINRNEHAFIQRQLAHAGVPDASVELKSATPADVPSSMSTMDMTMFFINPCFSKLASAPTKLGEFLGCGIPCLSNTGVGDMADILESERVGVAINSFDLDSLRAGLQRLLALLDEPGIRERCVTAAHKHFSLDDGVQRYAEVYRTLLDMP